MITESWGQKIYNYGTNNENTVSLLVINKVNPTCHWQMSMPSEQASELCSCHLKIKPSNEQRHKAALYKKQQLELTS